MRFAHDFHEDLVKMPAPLCGPTYGVRTPFADRLLEQGAESINPKPDAFMTDIDTAFMEQVFDIV